MKKLLTIASLALFAAQAFAGVTLLTSRSQINETSYIDWTDTGGDLYFPANPFMATTRGNAFDVRVASGGKMSTRIVGGPHWASGFTPGETILFTDNGSPLTLTGAKTCNDIGMRVERNSLGNFTVHMEAFNGIGQSLGAVTVAGLSQFLPDSAPFIGVHSSAGDIHAVSVWLTDTDGQSANGFAIDRVSYNCCGPVPEPASLSVLGLGAAALLRRKKGN